MTYGVANSVWFRNVGAFEGLCCSRELVEGVHVLQICSTGNRRAIPYHQFAHLPQQAYCPKASLAIPPLTDEAERAVGAEVFSQVFLQHLSLESDQYHPHCPGRRDQSRLSLQHKILDVRRIKISDN
jgi:hypothetical protein